MVVMKFLLCLWRACWWKKAVLASPSRRPNILDRCLAIVRSNEHKPKSFLLRVLRRLHSAGVSARMSIALSCLKITSMAIAICNLMFPIRRSLHCLSFFAVARNLRSSTTKGLPSYGTEAHASATVSEKLSSLVQKGSNLKRRPVHRSAFASSSNG